MLLRDFLIKEHVRFIERFEATNLQTDRAQPDIPVPGKDSMFHCPKLCVLLD